jgi:L-asparaginase II
MPAAPLRIEATRGDLVESAHPVSVAVVDRAGALVAHAGDADLVTYWRSAAKPFQAMPLIADGAADRFSLGAEELALACASHSSEPVHVAIALRMLEKIGCTEGDLACGPHPPLSAAVADQVQRNGITLTPAWSNCSGKHAGMLALARHHGWPTAGYERAGHPVQQRLLSEIARWTGVAEAKIACAVDGCTTVCYGVPLSAMALAYARFATANEDAPARAWTAMTGHPRLVAGSGRVCTELMAAAPGRLVAKVGAEGVYSAALREPGLGVAIKVEDGDGRSAQVALLEVLRQLGRRLALRLPLDALAGFTSPPILNTRGEQTGSLRASGRLRFAAQPRTQSVTSSGGETVS